MKIGFTYDCVEDYIELGNEINDECEFYPRKDIDIIADTLSLLGHKVIKIGNAKALIDRIHNGENWDIVFNISEGVKGRSRESHVPSILEIYDIPYVFSDPLVMSVTLDKAISKILVRGSGICTADFMIVEDAESLAKVSQELTFPVFVKPNAEGSSIGITKNSIIYSEKELNHVCADLRQYYLPILIESYLPGREFSVGIIGTGKDAKVLGVVEVKLREPSLDLCRSWDVKENSKIKAEHILATDQEAQLAAEYALKIWQLLGCRDAGRVDFRSNNCNIPHFLEVNPVPGLIDEYSDICILGKFVGVEYPKLLESILNSAVSRYPILL